MGTSLEVKAPQFYCRVHEFKIWSLVEELRSHMPYIWKKKKKERKKERKMCKVWQITRVCLTEKKTWTKDWQRWWSLPKVEEEALVSREVGAIGVKLPQ